MRSLTGAIAAVAITSAALVGCTSKSEAPKASEPKTTTIEISYDELQNQKQISRSVDLAVGDFLQISLGSNASTGFQWSEELLISDPKVMAQTAHEAITAGEDRPGAPGKNVWVAQAMEAGDTTVSATYGRPWPGGEKDIWVFTANVSVSK